LTLDRTPVYRRNRSSLTLLPSRRPRRSSRKGEASASLRSGIRKRGESVAPLGGYTVPVNPARRRGGVRASREGAPPRRPAAIRVRVRAKSIGGGGRGGVKAVSGGGGATTATAFQSSPQFFLSRRSRLAYPTPENDAKRGARSPTIVLSPFQSARIYPSAE